MITPDVEGRDPAPFQHLQPARRGCFDIARRLIVPEGRMRVAWHEVPGLEFGHFGRVLGRGTERGMSQRGASVGKIEEFFPLASA